jgi:hypothetical protein
MRMNRTLVAASVAGIVTGVAGAIWSVQAASGDPPTDRPRSTFSASEARSFRGFALYDAGPSALGLPRVAVLRRDQGPANYVSFVYGDCAATDDSGCAPPAEIQVWPACARNLSLYERSEGLRHERTTVRGAPAALFEGGRRLEVQTGGSTVVVFGRTHAQVLELGSLLRGVNVSLEPGNRLPPPVDGAVAGRLECGP